MPRSGPRQAQRRTADRYAPFTGTAKSQSVLTDCTTLAQFINKAYKLRFEVAHGSILAVHSQLDEEQDRVEEIAAVAIAEHVTKLATYAAVGGVDDRDAFRSSLPAAKP